MKIKIGRKVFEWSTATLVSRLMSWGFLKDYLIYVKMLQMLEKQMKQYYRKEKAKGNRPSASQIKQKAIDKLGNSGMSLLKRLDISEVMLYKIAQKSMK